MLSQLRCHLDTADGNRCRVDAFETLHRPNPVLAAFTWEGRRSTPRPMMDYPQHGGATTCRFQLAGDLAGARVTHLELAWQSETSIVGARQLALDSSGLSGVDAARMLAPCFPTYNATHDWDVVDQPRFDGQQFREMKGDCQRHCCSHGAPDQNICRALTGPASIAVTYGKLAGPNRRRKIQKG